MKTVYKYEAAQIFGVDLCAEHKVVLFAWQKGQPYIWVEEDYDTPKVLTHFKLLPTGVEIPRNYIHVASCLEDPPLGSFVWHLYRH